MVSGRKDASLTQESWHSHQFDVSFILSDALVKLFVCYISIATAVALGETDDAFLKVDRMTLAMRSVE